MEKITDATRLGNSEARVTVRNMFKGDGDREINEINGLINTKDILVKDIKVLCGYSLEELENLINAKYAKEKIDSKQSQEIATYREPIRIERGKEIIKEKFVDDWCNFVRHFDKTPIPFNFELESILKYLVKFNENIYSKEEIANQFVDEFGTLSNPSTLFILVNIAIYSYLSYYYLIKRAFEEKEQAQKYIIYKNQKDDLISRGISEKMAMPLIGTRIAKILEDNHDFADIMITPYGNMEGVDSNGNWIFMRESKTQNNQTFFILYKVNRESSMRYIINKDTNVAIMTNEKGTYKTKIRKKISIVEYPNLSIKEIDDHIESIITEISVVGISHDLSYEIANEMIELCSPINDEIDTLKVEEVFNEELQQLKKTHE